MTDPHKSSKEQHDNDAERLLNQLLGLDPSEGLEEGAMPSDAFEEGRQACRELQSVHLNPYSFQDERHAQWL